MDDRYQYVYGNLYHGTTDTKHLRILRLCEALQFKMINDVYTVGELHLESRIIVHEPMATCPTALSASVYNVQH